MYQFKQTPEDFYVSELLPKTFFANKDGQDSQFLCFFIQKKNLTTMGLIEFLVDETGLGRSEFGIAGLKDKVGITRQRISISKDNVVKIGGVDKFMEILEIKTTILETKESNKPLMVGCNSGNKFIVKLKHSPSKGKTTTEEIANITKKVEQIRQNGMLNYFGIQRFGRGMKNAKKITKILTANERKSQELYISRLLLQAYPSLMFNKYCDMRQAMEQKTGKYLLEGDILMDQSSHHGIRLAIRKNSQICFFDYESMKDRETSIIGGKKDYSGQKNTQKSLFLDDMEMEVLDEDVGDWMVAGPMMGSELLKPMEGSEARELEESWLEENGVGEDEVNFCELYRLWAYRRPYKIRVDDLVMEVEENNDIVLEFSLPMGSYASVLVDNLE